MPPNGVEAPARLFAQVASNAGLGDAAQGLDDFPPAFLVLGDFICFYSHTHIVISPRWNELLIQSNYTSFDLSCLDEAFAHELLPVDGSKDVKIGTVVKFLLLIVDENKEHRRSRNAFQSGPLPLLLCLHLNAKHPSVFGIDEEVGAFSIAQGELRIDATAAQLACDCELCGETKRLLRDQLTRHSIP